MRVIAYVLRLGHVLEMMNDLTEGLEQSAPLLVATIRCGCYAGRSQGAVKITPSPRERKLLVSILVVVLYCPVGRRHKRMAQDGESSSDMCGIVEVPQWTCAGILEHGAAGD